MSRERIPDELSCQSSSLHSDLDIILGAITQLISADAESFKRFSIIKWDTVENRYSPFMKHLDVVLNDSIKFQMNPKDYQILVKFYSKGTGRFDYKTFLSDLFTNLEKVSLRIPESKSHNFKVFNKFGMRTILPPSEINKKSISPHLQAIETSDINSKTMKNHVISKVIASIKAQFPLRLEYHVESFRAIADMDELQFARELKRVLSLNLSPKEAKCLFTMFDYNGTGYISEAELHEGLSKIRIHDMKKMKSFKSEDESSDNEHNLINDSNYVAFSENLTAIDLKKPTSHTNIVKSRRNIPYSFNQSDYSAAVKKISDVFASCNKDLALPQLSIPDTYLTCNFIRKAIFEQLNVRLTSGQINALCYKLASTMAEGKLGADQEFLNSKRDLIMGAEIKSLVVRIGLLVNKNPLLPTIS